jgi:calcineurin-like phosphoesterase family protein
VFCHYPLAEWSGYFRGWYHIYGHIHNNTTNPAFAFLKAQERALNAGVDINHFKPVTLSELIANNKTFKQSN